MVDEKELDLIEKATLVAERIERANEQYKELVKRSEQIESRRILGGQTAAGEKTPPPMTEEEKVLMTNKAMFKGTVLDGVFK